MVERGEIVMGGKMVRRDGEPVVIAEIGVNHDGDMKVGRELVAAAAKAGADGVKFQLFKAELLLAREAGLVEYQKKTGAGSAHDLLRELEFSAAQIGELVGAAHALGMVGLVTPFSVELVKEAVDTGVDGVKLASPDLVNRPLVEEVAGTGLPLVLSTGAARLEEIERAVGWLGSAQGRTVLLHCVSSYPTPEEMATLGGIGALRTRFGEWCVGYSDHTRLVETGGMAVCAGACFLEKHLTLDRRRKGPDHGASLEPGEFAAYVNWARRAWRMRGAYEKKVLDAELGVREQTRQSVVATRDLAAGQVLAAGDLTVKRPGTGIPAAGLRDLLGRKLVKPVRAGAMLRLGDLGDPED